MALGGGWPASAQEPDSLKVDLSGLLVSCYHAGALAGWGVYTVSEDGRLERALQGGRHPAWSANRDYWVCFRNGRTWVNRETGAGRPQLLPGPPSLLCRRYAQPLGPSGDWLAMLTPGVSGLPANVVVWPVNDAAAEGASPWEDDEVALNGVIGSRLQADLAGPEERLACEWGVRDFAASPDGNRLAVVGAVWARDWGTIRSHLYIRDAEAGTVERVTDWDDSILELNPHWLGASGALAFDAIDTAQRTRRTYVVDTVGTDPVLLEVHSDKRPTVGISSDTSVLAASPDGSLIALGASGTTGTLGPAVVACIVDRSGEVRMFCASGGPLWDIAWSPDGTRIAWIEIQHDAEPGLDTTSIGAQLWAHDFRTDTEDTVDLADWLSLDDWKSDPLIPYELAW